MHRLDKSTPFVDLQASTNITKYRNVRLAPDASKESPRVCEACMYILQKPFLFKKKQYTVRN